MTIQNKKELEEFGFTVVKSVIQDKWITSLQEVIDKIIVKYQKPQGMVLHSILYDSIYIELLYEMLTSGLISELEVNYFKSKCILNSMSTIDNRGNPDTFAVKYHRDLRFWSGDFNIMINCLVMIDSFTQDNGGTWILPGSHKVKEAPTVNQWEENKIQITGDKGDVLLFNSNLYHAGAENKTNNSRRAVPITLSKSCMKQLLDYPRAIGYDKQYNYPERLQSLLGYYSRVPASIEEWDQPESCRYYKKDQD